MKRMILTFAILVLVLGISLLSLIIGEKGGLTTFSVTTFSEHEKAITEIIFAILELVGLALAIILLHRYFRYLRPHWLVFEGFSNEAALREPVDLGMLAREVLKKDVDEIYNELKTFYGVDSDHVIENNLSPFLTSFQLNDPNTREIAMSLRSLRKSLKDQSGLDLMRSVGDMAPEKVAPVMKFINAIFPPPVIKSVGHLQWRDNTPGITFEIVDLGEQRNLNICTIWKESDSGGRPEEERTSSSGFTGAGYVAEDMKEKDQNGHKVGSYIDLLAPTMRWLALELWKQKMMPQESSTDRIFSLIPGLGNWEKKRKLQRAKQRVRLYLLLGALYYASANKFEKFNEFFYGLAINHLKLAIKHLELIIKEYKPIPPDSDEAPIIYSPYLYLASIYYHKLNKLPKGKEAMCGDLLREILNLYDEVLDLAKKTSLDKVIQYRIKVRQATVKAKVGERLGDQQLQKKAEEEMREIENAGPHPSSSITPEEYALYEMDLAVWCALKDENVARIHLGHSLILSKYARKWIESEEKVKDLCGEASLKALKEKLDEPSIQKDLLEDVRKNLGGDDFKRKMDEILRSAGWGREQR